MAWKRAGSAARIPAMVTSMPVTGTPVSLAYFSISVTPQEEIPARNASLLVNASLGPEEESRTKWCVRALLSARPGRPIERVRTVSTILGSATGVLHHVGCGRGLHRCLRWVPAPYPAWRG